MCQDLKISVYQTATQKCGLMLWRIFPERRSSEYGAMFDNWMSCSYALTLQFIFEFVLEPQASMYNRCLLRMFGIAVTKLAMCTK